MMWEEKEERIERQRVLALSKCGRSRKKLREWARETEL
jgi:hypothetical protein